MQKVWLHKIQEYDEADAGYGHHQERQRVTGSHALGKANGTKAVSAARRFLRARNLGIHHVFHGALRAD